MKNLFLYSSFASTLALMLHTGCLASEDMEEWDIPADMEAEGDWLPVSDGVWEMVQPDGTIRRHAEGHAGLRWMLPELEIAGEHLWDAYELTPTPEIWEQIQAHDRSLEELRERLADETADAPHLGVQPSPRASLASCSRSLSIVANAGPNNPGAYASADANWTRSGTCNDTRANVYAVARARVTSGGVTTEVIQTCSETNQANYSCPLRSASVSGSGTCYSRAEAYILVSAWGGTIEQLIRSNSSCGTSPPPPPPGDDCGSGTQQCQ